MEEDNMDEKPYQLSELSIALLQERIDELMELSDEMGVPIAVIFQEASSDYTEVMNVTAFFPDNQDSITISQVLDGLALDDELEDTEEFEE